MDDWKPGDLALCVRAGSRHDGLWVMAGANLRAGAIYTVTAASLHWSGFPVLFLAEDVSPEGREGRWAGRFRKIAPLTDEEREESLRDLKLPAEVAGEIVS